MATHFMPEEPEERDSEESGVAGMLGRVSRRRPVSPASLLLGGGGEDTEKLERAQSAAQQAQI